MRNDEIANPSTESSGPSAISLIGAAAAGAALMYYFDPQRGHRRQKRLRDQLVHAGHVGADFLGSAKRDTVNRLRGMAAEARTAVRHSTPDDRVLEERVRAELGRSVSHPGAVDVEAVEGTILLRGNVLTRERDALLESVAKVRGVNAVEDHLNASESAENIPALQGAGRLREKRFELAQENWSPAVRLATSVFGAALTAYGRRRKGIVGALASLGGMALLARATTNEDLKQVVGIRNGPRPHEFIH